jgi:hypothetical protein
VIASTRSHSPMSNRLSSIPASAHMAKVANPRSRQNASISSHMACDACGPSQNQSS